MCADQTPPEVFAKSGRAQIRVYQNLDDGTYECAAGHKVEIGEYGAVAPAVSLPPVELEPVTPQPGADSALAASPSSQQAAVAVEESPQAYQAHIVPGSIKMHQGGAMEIRLMIPEQFVGPLCAYCEGMGQTVEEYMSQVIAQGFENNWFM
jgi:hypothetical protein